MMSVSSPPSITSSADLPPNAWFDTRVAFVLLDLTFAGLLLLVLSPLMLVLARSDSGKLAVEHAPVDIPALLERLATRFGVAASAADRLTIEGDVHRLEQALGNLIDNARRYGAGRVELSACTLDGQLELHVTDEGQGFPDDFLPRAFARFSRADESSQEGAGLGLAIAETIAAAHGGIADAANRPAGGADVWLSVPFRLSSAGATRSELPRATV